MPRVLSIVSIKIGSSEYLIERWQYMVRIYPFSVDHGPGAGYSHTLFGWGCAVGFAKVLPFTRVNFANFVTLYQSTLSIFCYYNFVRLAIYRRNPILDQFSMITRPYPRVNGLKTIPFSAALTRVANSWEYPTRIMVFKLRSLC